MRFFVPLTLAAVLTPVLAHADNLQDALDKVASAATEAGVSADAQQAWRVLAAADAEQIPRLLEGMPSDQPLAANWVRTAVDAVAERALQSDGSLPISDLKSFAVSRDQAPKARATALELVAKVDPPIADELLATMLDDASRELRYQAIAKKLEAIEDRPAEESLPALQELEEVALDLEQRRRIADKLRDAGGEPEPIVEQLGFITRWWAVAPFDNTDESAFDIAYPPESLGSYEEADFAVTYEGKDGPAEWKFVTASMSDGEDLGRVDLNAQLGRVKGAVAYVLTAFEAEPGDAVLRYSSKNATKAWLNGELVASNQVYHSGGGLDQFTAPVTIGPGVNTLMMKVCQNEQTQRWAQDWFVAVRLTNAIGETIPVEPAVPDETGPVE